jgi:4-nitrophenyl phosphatase
MDGVVWTDNEQITGSVKALIALRAAGRPIVFVTNGSGKSRDQIASKLDALGYPCTVDEIVTSGFVAAQHVRKQLIPVLSKPPQPQETVFVIGGPQLRREIEKVGFNVRFVSDSEPPGLSAAEFTHLEREAPSISAVVTGFDEKFTYRKLATASLFLQKVHNMPFFATNTDFGNRLPNSDLLSPECGSIVAAIEASCGGLKRAINCGKPSSIIVEFCQNKLQISDPTRILMIGDRLDTDIEFANRSGFLSCLVLSGCTTSHQVAAEMNPLRKPTVVAADLHDLVSSYI